MSQDVTLGLREWPLPHESWQMTHDAMAKLVSWFFHTYWEVTGWQPVGQNAEPVPISNCKYSWVLSLSSTVLCVNLARENVKGNIFNLMIVGMGLIIWLVGQQRHTLHFWFIENLTGNLRLKTLLIVLVHSVSISHNKETVIKKKKKSHLRLLMICAIYPVCTCTQGGLCMRANVMRAEMHMPGGSSNPYQVRGVSR